MSYFITTERPIVPKAARYIIGLCEERMTFIQLYSWLVFMSLWKLSSESSGHVEESERGERVGGGVKDGCDEGVYQYNGYN